MRTTTLRAAASVAAAVIGFGSVASAQQQSSTDQPQQQLEQTKRQEKTEMRQQGDRKVEVREMALWTLGDLPPKLMHKAMEKLADEPQEARKAVMQAANIIELQASLAIQKAQAQAVQQQTSGQGTTGQGQTSASSGGNQATGDQRISGSGTSGQSRDRDKGGVGAYQAATGGDWSNTRDQGLWKAAEELRELAMRIEYRQTLNKDELREPFARAAVAMASFYQKSAESGLQRQDEEQTGYTLKGAAEYLAAAHAFGQRKPSAEASRAMFDGERMASQIIKLSKPTTLQRTQKNDTARAGGEGDLSDAARTAGDRRTAEQIPQEAGRVIANLGDAIRQIESREGTTGSDTGRPQDRRNDQDRPDAQDRR